MSSRRDLVAIPFHDWRKVQREGSRTRDAHVISHLARQPDIDRVVVLNRPMSVAESAYTRRSWKTKGDVLATRSRSRLVQVDRNFFVVDYLDTDLLAPIWRSKGWFFDAYGKDAYVDEIRFYLSLLDLRPRACLNFSVYASQLLPRLDTPFKVFDAWDNFMRFPNLRRWRDLLARNYQLCAETCDAWTTNSEDNRRFYRKEFGVTNCRVIGNGVDIDLFARSYPVPDDIGVLDRPIAGIGAKVTHLLDIDLVNYIAADNPDVNVVLVGQILDKRRYAGIRRRPNFHYLGDKHYSLYPAYVQAFDVCLIPYVTGALEHGQDTIKYYEYLAAGKPVVTTAIRGVRGVDGSVYVAEGEKSFSRMVRQAVASAGPSPPIDESISWKCRAEAFMNVLTKGVQSHETCHQT